MTKIIDDGYMTSEYYKPCIVCGKLTNKIEYNYEAYICSYECENIMDEKLMEAELKGEMI